MRSNRFSRIAVAVTALALMFGVAAPARSPAILKWSASSTSSRARSQGELAVAAERNLPLVIIVLNDAKLSLIAVKQDRMGMRARGVDFRPPDFARIAQGFGAHGVRVDSLAEFDIAFDAALAARRLTVIEAMVDPAEYWEQM